MNKKEEFELSLLEYIKFKYFKLNSFTKEDLEKTVKEKDLEILSLLNTKEEKLLLSNSLYNLTNKVDNLSFNRLLKKSFAKSNYNFREHINLSYSNDENYEVYLEFLTKLININTTDLVLLFDDTYDLFSKSDNIYLYNPLKYVNSDLYTNDLIYTKILNILYKETIKNKKFLEFNYESNYYDKIINFSKFNELQNIDNKLSEYKNNTLNYNYLSILYTLNLLKDKGKALVLVDYSFLDSNLYFLERFNLINSEFIESVILLRHTVFLIISKEKKEYITFVNVFDNLNGFSKRFITSSKSEEIINCLRKKEENIYIRNIKYSYLKEKGRTTKEKYEFYKNRNLNVEEIDLEEKKFSLSKHLSLNPRDFIEKSDLEYKSTEKLNKELEECYNKLFELIKN